MKFFQKESGITLVELLAGIVIGSIIIILTISLFMTFHDQYGKQSAEIRDLMNVSIAAQIITKDVRSAIDIQVNPAKDQLTIIQPEQSITYEWEADDLKKNGHIFLYDIDEFVVDFNEDTQTLYIKIHGSANQQVKTSIVLRKDGK